MSCSFRDPTKTNQASETGAIAHKLAPGSIIATGDLIASLELSDPSKVAKIVPFEDVFDAGDGYETETDEQVKTVENLTLLLAGYESSQSPEKLVNELFTLQAPERAVEAATQLLASFQEVEARFAGRALDQVRSSRNISIPVCVLYPRARRESVSSSAARYPRVLSSAAFVCILECGATNQSASF